MAESTIWWLATGVAVAVELLTGTFYLLMLAIGLAAGALAAHAGQAPAVQLLVAAVVGGGAVLAWHLKRPRSAQGLPAEANRDVNLDIGETVQVDAWRPDGTASVRYRGAQWTVAARSQAAGVPLMPGAHRVVEVVGNRLLVDKV